MKYFKIDYKLGVKGSDGSIEPFSKTVTNYTANLIAKTPDIAKGRLQKMFNMVNVDIVGCEEHEMTVEEYIGKGN